MSRAARIGQVFILSSVALEGLFPVITKASSSVGPAIWFAGVSQLLSSALLAGVITLQGWRNIRMDAALIRDVLGTAFFIVVIPMALIFTGARMTSGIDTGLLLPVEVPVTAVISWWLFREPLSQRSLLGVTLAVAGAVAVLWRGSGVTGVGDLLILASVAFLPFGNRCAKRAIAVLRGSEILFLRSLIGGLVLLALSAGVEQWPALPLSRGAIVLLAVYVLLILVGGKMLWYAGLRRLRVVDAVSLISATPAFSLFCAILFLGERPTILHASGFVLIVFGLILLTWKKSTAAPRPSWS